MLRRSFGAALMVASLFLADLNAAGKDIASHLQTISVTVRLAAPRVLELRLHATASASSGPQAMWLTVCK